MFVHIRRFSSKLNKGRIQQGAMQPELEEYNKSMHELRKKYAAESSHIKSASVRDAEARATKRAQIDAQWNQYLEKMRTALNDPTVPTGIDSMHKSLRSAPALRSKRDRLKYKEAPQYREEAMQRHISSMAGIVENRRKYLQLLSEESENWVTEANLMLKIQKAIDNPVDYNEQVASIAQREAEVQRRLDELRAEGSLTADDTSINPVNFH